MNQQVTTAERTSRCPSDVELLQTAQMGPDVVTDEVGAHLTGSNCQWCIESLGKIWERSCSSRMLVGLAERREWSKDGAFLVALRTHLESLEQSHPTFAHPLINRLDDLSLRTSQVAGTQAKLLGDLRRAAGKDLEVVAAYEQGIALGSGPAAVSLGDHHLNRGRTAEAITAYQAGIDLGSGAAAARLGDFHLDAGRETEALGAYRSAVDLGNEYAAVILCDLKPVDDNERGGLFTQPVVVALAARMGRMRHAARSATEALAANSRRTKDTVRAISQGMLTPLASSAQYASAPSVSVDAQAAGERNDLSELFTLSHRSAADVVSTRSGSVSVSRDPSLPATLNVTIETTSLAGDLNAVDDYQRESHFSAGGTLNRSSHLAVFFLDESGECLAAGSIPLRDEQGNLRAEASVTVSTPPSGFERVVSVALSGLVDLD